MVKTSRMFGLIAVLLIQGIVDSYNDIKIGENKPIMTSTLRLLVKFENLFYTFDSIIFKLRFPLKFFLFNSVFNEWLFWEYHLNTIRKWLNKLRQIMYFQFVNFFFDCVIVSIKLNYIEFKFYGNIQDKFFERISVVDF